MNDQSSQDTVNELDYLTLKRVSTSYPKFEGIASSGAEAKDMIAAGTVLVNGIIEKQKRKKMVAGDTIELNGEIFRLKLGAN